MLTYTGQKYKVVAKEWFDRFYGNTYFSARIYDENDTLLLCLEEKYGTGHQYLASARNSLADLFNDKDSIIVQRTPFTILFFHHSRETAGSKRAMLAWGKFSE